MALIDLISDSEVRVNTVFALACFITFTGFVAAVSMYAYYGFWLQKDMTPMLADITKWFVGFSGAGGFLAWLGKPAAGS